LSFCEGGRAIRSLTNGKLAEMDHISHQKEKEFGKIADYFIHPPQDKFLGHLKC
jgi:hypothetical protein